MPLYEYVCPNCDTKFERLRSMNDGRHADCSLCGVESPRVLSVFAAFIKGSQGETAAVGGGACGGVCPSGCSCAHRS